ncbi:MAG: transcription termination factor NusA [Dongiaceae bacterium]
MLELLSGQLIQAVDAAAREKGLEREEMFIALEQAIQKAARAKYGYEHDIRAEIDRKDGKVTIMRVREVADPIVNDMTQISLKDAKKIKKDIKLGEFITDILPSIDFGRISASNAKQVVVSKVREAERQKQFREYKDKIGEIIYGIVKRVEFGNVIVDLGKGEAMLRRDELLPRETFRQGDRVRAYIYDVRAEARGPQIFLSRTHPQFMAKLFAQEVPEIYDGVIEIKAVSRDPGSRAKMAVISKDHNIDPVGACIGMRGSRVTVVSNELQGEKVDIVLWSPDPATFVVNALNQAEVTKVVVDEESNRLEVVVPDEQLSLAIGRRGQNVRLASMLVGWDIDILTEAEESQRRQEEYKVRSQLFLEALDVDEVIAHLLVSEGFTSVDDIAAAPLEDLSGIEGFSSEVAGELHERAKAFVAERDQKFAKECEALKISEELATTELFSKEQILLLGQGGVKTLNDVADLAGDELVEMLAASPIDKPQAEKIIMDLRASWFADEPKPGDTNATTAA